MSLQGINVWAGANCEPQAWSLSAWKDILCWDLQGPYIRIPCPYFWQRICQYVPLYSVWADKQWPTIPQSLSHWRLWWWLNTLTHNQIDQDDQGDCYFESSSVFWQRMTCAQCMLPITTQWLADAAVTICRLLCCWPDSSGCKRSVQEMYLGMCTWRRANSARGATFSWTGESI